MDFEDIRCFDDLNDLYWKNRELLGEEEQRLFRGILLELRKGEYCDYKLLEKLMLRLGEKRELL